MVSPLSEAVEPGRLPEGWVRLSEAQATAWSQVLTQIEDPAWVASETWRVVAGRPGLDPAVLCRSCTPPCLWYVFRRGPGASLRPEFTGDWAGFLAAEALYIVDEDG